MAVTVKLSEETLAPMSGRTYWISETVLTVFNKYEPTGSQHMEIIRIGSHSIAK